MIRLMNRNWKVVTFQIDKIAETGFKWHQWMPKAQDLKNAQILGKLAISVLYEGKWSAMWLCAIQKTEAGSKSTYLFHRYLSESQKIITCHTCLHVFIMFASLCSFIFFPYNWTLRQQNPLADSSGACEWLKVFHRLNYAIDLLCDAIHVCLSQRANSMLYTLSWGKKLLRSNWNKHPWVDKEMYDKCS